MNTSHKVLRKGNNMPLCWLSQNLIFHAISSALKKWNGTSVLKGVSGWPFISCWEGCYYSPSTVHITTVILTFICNKLSLLHEILNDSWRTGPWNIFWKAMCMAEFTWPQIWICSIYLKVRQCWFATLGARWVKSEIGLHTRRAKRERGKR